MAVAEKNHPPCGIAEVGISLIIRAYFISPPPQFRLKIFLWSLFACCLNKQANRAMALSTWGSFNFVMIRSMRSWMRKFRNCMRTISWPSENAIGEWDISNWCIIILWRSPHVILRAVFIVWYDSLGRGIILVYQKSSNLRWDNLHNFPETYSRVLSLFK